MVNKVADRVLEVTTTIGEDTIELAGSVSGFQSFLSGFTDGEIVEYCMIAINNDGSPAGAWEVGYGTFTDASPDTITRTTIRASSNSGAKVSFPAGTKHVFANAPAAWMQLLGYQSGKHLDLSGMTSHGTLYGMEYDSVAGGGVATAVDNSAFKKIGAKEHLLPFSAWHIGGITDPAGTGSTPETNYGLERWSFSNSGTRYLECLTRLPQSWDAGTFTLDLLTTIGAATAEQYKFFAQARCFGNEDNSDGAWGTVQSVVINKTAARDAYELLINTTPAITPANSPAKGDWLNIRVYRDPADGDDTYGFSAFLAGAVLNYTDDAQTDA